MAQALAVIGSVAVVGAFYVVVPVIGATYRRFRGSRTITCPEVSQAAEIEIDAMHAAASAAFGPPALEIMRCSRWPEREHCGRECLAGMA